METLVSAMALAMNLPARVVRLPEWVLGSTTSAGDACQRLGLPAPWTSEVKGRLLGGFYVHQMLQLSIRYGVGGFPGGAVDTGAMAVSQVGKD